MTRKKLERLNFLRQIVFFETDSILCFHVDYFIAD